MKQKSKNYKHYQISNYSMRRLYAYCRMNALLINLENAFNIFTDFQCLKVKFLSGRLFKVLSIKWSCQNLKKLGRLVFHIAMVGIG